MRELPNPYSSPFDITPPLGRVPFTFAASPSHNAKRDRVLSRSLRKAYRRPLRERLPYGFGDACAFGILAALTVAGVVYDYTTYAHGFTRFCYAFAAALLHIS